MKLTELLAVLSPGGSVIGATAVRLASSQTGRALADDVLRGAGIGGISGTALAFVIWLGDEIQP